VESRPDRGTTVTAEAPRIPTPDAGDMRSPSALPAA
jgi:hypothetical protein